MELKGKRFSLSISRRTIYIAIHYKGYWTRFLYNVGHYCMLYRVFRQDNKRDINHYFNWTKLDGYSGSIVKRYRR